MVEMTVLIKVKYHTMRSGGSVAAMRRIQTIAMDAKSPEASANNATKVKDQENADISDANGPLRSRWGWFFQPYPGDDGNKKRRGHMEYDGFGEGDRGKCEEVTVHGSQASG